MEDFSPISKELTFTRDDLLQCVLINATQDELVEGPENFNISLSSSSDINLVRDMATIILLDDGKEGKSLVELEKYCAPKCPLFRDSTVLV